MGLLISFSSLAHVPRSINLHFSEQNGRKMLVALRSASLLHLGQSFFIVWSDLDRNDALLMTSFAGF